ncbi:MAG: hypothetical protein QOF60_946 [Actinomycetota bacterium]|nr:hypothetical protein [Actinomycetota bacterium]
MAGLLLSSMIGGPSASAETTVVSPETYVGSAAGRALVLRVASISASSGVSSAKLDSTLKAASEGAGSLGLPVFSPNSTKAEVSGDNKNDTKTKVCSDIDLPPDVKAALAPLLAIGAACSSSLAEVVNGQPHSLSEASVLNVDVTANTVLSSPTLAPIATVKDTVVGTLLGGLDTVNKQVSSTNSAVPDLKLDDTIGEMLTRLQSTKTLDLKVGTSRSEVVTNGSTVTSTATSAGGVLGLLPVQLPLAAGGTVTQNLVEIVIGSAKATATYDRVTGKSGTPVYDPAIVTIRINTPTTDALGKVLGVNFKEIQVIPGVTPALIPALNAAVDPVVATIVKACPDAPNEFCVLYGTPFETRIAVASGRAVSNADGTVGAIADAVKIHALKNIGTLAPQLDGGILLELAHAEAGVGGAPAVTNQLSAPGTPDNVVTPDVPRELPRTGGTPWMPIVGALGLALAVLSRRALVRSH